MRLRHIHLPSPVPYLRASSIQEPLVAQFLHAKATRTPLPRPTILTFQTHPTYTLGRRDNNSLTPGQTQTLSANGAAEVHYALRGGQTTFHGPGQMVAYPILDLKTHGLTPRTYVCLLEKSLIQICKGYGVAAMTTENTGVWVSEEKKIAAIGVHMRRFVTSHGVALNVSTDLSWFERIVACGLEGKKTTSLEAEGASLGSEVMREVSERFAVEVARRIGYEGVDLEEGHG